MDPVDKAPPAAPHTQTSDLSPFAGLDSTDDFDLDSALEENRLASVNMSPTVLDLVQRVRRDRADRPLRR